MHNCGTTNHRLRYSGNLCEGLSYSEKIKSEFLLAILILWSGRSYSDLSECFDIYWKSSTDQGISSDPVRNRAREFKIGFCQKNLPWRYVHGKSSFGWKHQTRFGRKIASCEIANSYFETTQLTSSSKNQKTNCQYPTTYKHWSHWIKTWYWWEEKCGN